jgi:hypothetical protein
MLKNHALNEGVWSGGAALHILDLGIRRKWVVELTLRPIYPRVKSLSQYLLNRRLGRPQGRSGRGGEEKSFHYCPCREPNPGRTGIIIIIIIIIIILFDRVVISVNDGKSLSLRRVVKQLYMTFRRSVSKT